jgi:energy-coupling factor transporter transmembrane protein EcfT
MEPALAKYPSSGDRFVLVGWILFLIGCALFVVAGIRSRDLISTIASGLFFLGCVFFLIPMFKKR